MSFLQKLSAARTALTRDIEESRGRRPMSHFTLPTIYDRALRVVFTTL